MRQIRIAQRHQFELDVLLGGRQLLFQLLHVLLLRAFQKGRRMAVDAVAGSQSLAVTGQVGCQFLHLVHLPGLHDQETIGDKEAELDGQIRAVERHPFSCRPFHLHERQRREELQRLEKLGDGGRGELIHAQLLSEMRIFEQILGDVGLSFLLAETQPRCQSEREKRRTEPYFHARKMTPAPPIRNRQFHQLHTYLDPAHPFP